MPEDQTSTLVRPNPPQLSKERYAFQGCQGRARSSFGHHNMGEQELLFQVLNSDEMGDAEVKHWLDDAFGAAEDMKNKHSKFKQYDPLSFVVTILNFLREDTAPLLAPSGERSQTIDHPSPASAVLKERAAGGWRAAESVEYHALNDVQHLSDRAPRKVHHNDVKQIL